MISAVTLQLLATLMGLVGTACVIAQALLWIARAQVNLGVLVLTGCVPLVAAVIFAFPRRIAEDRSQSYRLQSPMVWINLALPLVLAALTMVLIGTSDSFDRFSGFALLLALNAGRNLRDFVRSLLLRTTDARQ